MEIMRIGKIGVAAVCAASLALSALPAAANSPTVLAAGTQQDGVRHDRDRHDRHDEDEPYTLGNVQMAPGSDFSLNAIPSTIVSILAAPPRGGRVVVTASGMLCVGHTAGTDDSATLQIMVDNVASGSARQISVPATQRDGEVCSSFNLTAGFNPFLAQSHLIRLIGAASGASTHVTGANLNAMVYPDPAYHDHPRR